MSPNLDDSLLNEDYHPISTIKLNKSDITEFQNLLGDLKNNIELITQKFHKAEDCILKKIKFFQILISKFLMLLYNPLKDQKVKIKTSKK